MAATPTTPVEIRGRYLWQNDKRFLVRGVVYQAHDNDNFSLAGRDLLQDDRLARLQLAVDLFKELGVNTVNVYAIDYTKDHSRAMRMLEDAGIYVLFVSSLTLASVRHCIHRPDPQGSYTADTVGAFFRTMDAMARFPNTLGFLIADHLINDTRSERCAPVITAVIRDLKRYMSLKHRATGQRILPVGFGGAEYEHDLKVLRCLAAGDESSCVDFWTCTGYGWTETCDKAANGFEDLAAKYRNIDIPIFFSEYGNNSKTPRIFRETSALYSPEMTAVFSGGCVYEFWGGSNKYGLATMEFKDVETVVPGMRIRPKEPGHIADTRLHDLGTLTLFEDFMIYKERLTDSVDIEAYTDDAPVSTERKEGWIDQLFGHNTIEGEVPESCMDWARIEREVVAS